MPYRSQAISTCKLFCKVSRTTEIDAPLWSWVLPIEQRIMNLVTPLWHATAAAASTTSTTSPLLVPTADAAIPQTEPESGFPHSIWGVQASGWRRQRFGEGDTRETRNGASEGGGRGKGQLGPGRTGGTPSPVKRRFRRVAASGRGTLDIGWKRRGERENDWDAAFGVGSGGAPARPRAALPFLLFTPTKVYLCCILWLRTKIGPSVNQRKKQRAKYL
jgi:hypothetical protein